MTEQKPMEELSFREAMTQLEGIVSLLESNTLDLEDSLKNYERGVALLASLQKRLTAADQQVQVLVGELSSLGSDAEQDTTLS